jgi:hypothetical protein
LAGQSGCDPKKPADIEIIGIARNSHYNSLRRIYRK